jgi:hypothetical protein
MLKYAILLLVLAPRLGAAQNDPERTRALAIEREVQRIAAGPSLWPEYRPLTIPLAIFTGSHTYLFRHPAPPADFVPLSSAPVALYAGRYPAVTSNTSVEIGGTMTATLRADLAPRATELEMAAVALHEAFHVYQRAHHKSWSANEGDLFLYPTDDARLLGLRRLESAALRTALAGERVACWASLAMRYRAQRFAAMDSAFSTYERHTELNEGLAAYVQLRARGESTIAIPAAEFPAQEVRARSYVIGPALGLLLDGLRPDWKTALDANDAQFIDQFFRTDIAGCDLDRAQIVLIERTARTDSAALAAARTARRRAFDARPGWRIVIQAADGRPLWPQGFDPLNVERTVGGVLHTRFLRLGNEAGFLEALDQSGADLESLTEGAGAHPLFNGVQRVTIAGIAKPESSIEDDRLTVRAPGVTIQFTKATTRLEGTETLVITLP